MRPNGSLTVLVLRGVPLRLHWSVLFLIPVVALGVQSNAVAIALALQLPVAEIGVPAWALGIIVATGLLASIALHELAHTLYAVRHGGRVESIVLMALGGISQVTRMPERPRHELVMALVGPLSSFVLAALCGVGYVTTRSAPTLALPLFLLAYANAALGLFNLAPAFPMDGGRVLRASLTRRLGRRRATRVAVSIGRVLAVVFALLGLLGGGLWLLLIAAFVWLAGSQEALHVELAGSLGELRVGELVHAVPRIDATASLLDALELLRRTGAESLLVERSGVTIGVLRLRDVLAWPAAARSSEPVARHLLQTDSLLADEPLAQTFDRVLRDGEVPVRDPTGATVGVVRAEAVLRELSRRNPQLPPTRNGQA